MEGVINHGILRFFDSSIWTSNMGVRWAVMAQMYQYQVINSKLHSKFRNWNAMKVKSIPASAVQDKTGIRCKLNTKLADGKPIGFRLFFIDFRFFSVFEKPKSVRLSVYEKPWFQFGFRLTDSTPVSTRPRTMLKLRPKPR